jgi:hypothetical protein
MDHNLFQLCVRQAILQLSLVVLVAYMVYDYQRTGNYVTDLAFPLEGL